MNKEKMQAIIGKLLDEANESLDEKGAINPDTLTALQIMIQLTSLNYQID
ncbi:hypothetical protein LPY66_18425 [Dehalobacter sp. DCM]|nr:hypothetical protein LPY66_18425 [Dehalobacter sp. DCM]